MVIGQGSQVSLSRKGSAQTADGILDSAFLPGRMGIAEESLDSQGMEVIVASELGAVVEGDSLAPGLGQRSQDAGDGVGVGASSFTGRTKRQEESGMAFMESEDSLTVGAEEHEICLPMAWTSTVLGLWRALRQGTADEAPGGVGNGVHGE